jgi:hypothetical protein
MRLGLDHATPATPPHSIVSAEPETIQDAVAYLFPLRPLTEDEMATEFDRLFPVT